MNVHEFMCVYPSAFVCMCTFVRGCGCDYVQIDTYVLSGPY